MNINNTMQADALDILFANRNKTYGAYQLRRNYSKRLLISILVMMGICLFASAVFKWNALHQTASSTLFVSDEINLTKAATKEPKPIQPPPLKLKPIEKPQIATLKFATPKLVTEDVPPPPTQDDATNMRIDVVTRKGIADDETMPPIEQSIGSGENLIKTSEAETTIHFVQQQAQFPGGLDAWKKFLERNLRSTIPSENGAAVGNYTVIVSFLVDKTGAISEVKADNDPGYGTAAEAVRVIQRGPAWTPAVQNGRNVIYRQKQAITFVVAEQE